jgi:hypothetical protein
VRRGDEAHAHNGLPRDCSIARIASLAATPPATTSAPGGSIRDRLYSSRSIKAIDHRLLERCGNVFGAVLARFHARAAPRF